MLSCEKLNFSGEIYACALCTMCVHYIVLLLYLLMFPVFWRKVSLVRISVMHTASLDSKNYRIVIQYILLHGIAASNRVTPCVENVLSKAVVGFKMRCCLFVEICMFCLLLRNRKSPMTQKVPTEIATCTFCLFFLPASNEGWTPQKSNNGKEGNCEENFI